MLLFKIIKPVFPYCISKLCLHLKGPTAVRDATQMTQEALQNRPYRYCMRIDIHSYFASIDHNILLDQIKTIFQDPRLQGYFEQIVTALIDRNAALYTYSKGIPLRASLSPFFAALYLTPLDQAFENRKGIFYVRFVDDFLILAETKTQYHRAKKILFKQLNDLKLTLSPTKTKMGRLTSFHFLGVTFEVARTSSDKNQATMTLHNRSHRRALNKVKILSTGAKGLPHMQASPKERPWGKPPLSGESLGHPNDVQDYCVRWSAWWKCALDETSSVHGLLAAWFEYSKQKEPHLARFTMKALDRTPIGSGKCP